MNIFMFRQKKGQKNGLMISRDRFLNNTQSIKRARKSYCCSKSFESEDLRFLEELTRYIMP